MVGWHLAPNSNWNWPKIGKMPKIEKKSEKKFLDVFYGQPRTTFHAFLCCLGCHRLTRQKIKFEKKLDFLAERQRPLRMDWWRHTNQPQPVCAAESGHFEWALALCQKIELFGSETKKAKSRKRNKKCDQGWHIGDKGTARAQTHTPPPPPQN